MQENLLQETIKPIVVEEGFELVDIEYHQRRGNRALLRIYIDKEGGVTLDDCAHISEEIGQIIEIKDLIPHSYILEVSSPGLERPLKKEGDFVRSIGKMARIKTRDSISYKGRILDFKEGKVKLEIRGEIVEVPNSIITKARLEYKG